MARELLLAQSSDWAFQIYQGTTVQYSSRRFQMHIQRFNMLADMLSEPGAIATGFLSPDQLDLLTEIESRDNIFAEIDWRAYVTRT
jgi:1,4-alpha-glucan branching enzyme